MKKLHFPVLFIFLFFIVRHSLNAEVSYQEQVQPILQRACQGCHNPSDPAGDLSVTNYADFKRGGGEGNLFVGGKPDQSLIFSFIVGDPPTMPLNADPLTVDEINLIRQWILEGAIDDTQSEQIPNLNEPIEYQKPPVISALAFSPDGHQLAVSGYSEALIHHSDGSGIIARLIGKSHRIESIAYAQDGRTLAIVGGIPATSGEVQIWETDTYQLLHSIESTKDTLYGVSFSPDGQLIAYGCSDETARLVRANDLGEKLKFDNHSNWVLGTAFSVDGTHLVTAGRDRALKLTEVESGSFIDDINASNKGYGEIYSLARHPKKDQILAAGEDGIPRLYKIFRTTRRDVGNTDFNLIRAFDRQSSAVNVVAFSASGKQIAIGGDTGEVRIYETETGDHVWTLSADSTSVFALAFNPNKNQIVVGGFDGWLRTFDLESGKIVKKFIPVPLNEKTKENLEQSSPEFQEIER